MSRKQTKPQSDPIEPEFMEEPEAEDEGAEDEANGKAISKASAVREALASGNDSPEDGVSYIRDTHGIEISRQMFSSYKAQQKVRDAKTAGKARAKRGPKASKPEGGGIEGYLAPPPKARINGGDEPDVLLALESVKDLVDRFGADKLKRIVDLLG